MWLNFIFKAITLKTIKISRLRFHSIDKRFFYGGGTASN
jgi:hypothetical protein